MPDQKNPKRTGSQRRKEARAADEQAEQAGSEDLDLTAPAKFNLDAFIAGKVTPTTTVQVTTHPQAATTIAELVAERDQVVAAMRQVEDLGQSQRRLVVKSDRQQRLDAIDAQVDQLKTDTADTWLDVKFRAITVAQRDYIMGLKLKTPFERTIAHFVLVGTVRAAGTGEEWAKLEPEQWSDLAEAVGVGQWEMLDRECGTVCYGQAVTPDFYSRLSLSPETGTTSTS